MKSRDIAPPFLTSALGESDWSASRPGRFAPDIHWILDWLGRCGRCKQATDYQATAGITIEKTAINNKLRI
jgi:hypothetical protein